MVKKFLLATVICLLVPTTALANDVSPTPTPSESSSSSPDANPSSTPNPGSIYDIPVAPYNPPAEASQGVGGWAVVHPGTGVVHGVIVGTIETFNTWGGRMPHDYMGCPAGCLLRFQTRATADGNVAGWHGPEVTYNNSDQTFNLGYSNTDSQGTTKVTQKLIPSQTALDGINLQTGIINIRTEFISSRINDLAIKLTKIQDRFDSPTESVIEITDLPTLTYSSDEQVVQNLDSDLDQILTDQGYDLETPAQGGFVETVRELTETVKRFFGGFFNQSEQPQQSQ